MPTINAGLCICHYRGVSPSQSKVPFFVPGCKACEKKRLAGKVTGLEGPPIDTNDRTYKRNGSPQMTRQSKSQNIAAAQKRKEFPAWKT